MRSTMAPAAARPAAILSWPGWPNTTPVIVVRLPSIQRMARKAKQPPAAAVEPVLTPTKPSCPSNVFDVEGAAGTLPWYPRFDGGAEREVGSDYDARAARAGDVLRRLGVRGSKFEARLA